MDEKHAEILSSTIGLQRELWQPSVGPETARLLGSAPLTDEDEAVVRSESVKILSRCASPDSADVRTGLAVGYVQSGKTLSFTTVIALARDNGFPLIILLAGTKENLHRQTSERLSRDLQIQRKGGLSPWAILENPIASEAAGLSGNIASLLDPSTPEKFRRATIITVMKNPSRLNRVRELVDSLSSHGVDLSSLPVLLVDDEADQAGLNAAIQDDDKDATATYRAIVDLRSSLPRHTYLMYTATPQANLLINLADVLSPDFVTVLTPGAGYTGGEYFFEQHRNRFVRRLSSNEVTAALEATEEPPQTLQRALATYYLGVAQRGEGPISMLVHPSHTKDLHGTYRAFVAMLGNQWANLLKSPGEDRQELIHDVFRPAYDDLVRGGASMRSLEDLLDEMPYWINATQIRIVNSQAEADREIRWDDHASWILVGGNKLDRGFTVEGLTVTYMPRRIGAGQVDSIQQRARFFGYKREYAELCRAWINGQTADVFEHYVEHEQHLRAQLVDSDDAGESLADWKRKMLLDPAFKPTRRAVIDIDYSHERVRPNRWASLDHVPTEDSASGPLEELWGRHAVRAVNDSRDERRGQANLRSQVPLREIVEALLDWVGPDQIGTRGSPAAADVVRANQLALLFQVRMDEDPSLVADLYLMDSGDVRSRTATGGSVDLPTGRSRNYPGDDQFFTEGLTSIQLHRVRVIAGPLMLGLRVRIPTQLAGGALVQT